MTWPLVPLKDCTRVVSGATPKSNVPDYWDGDVAWVTPKDLANLRSKYIEDTPRKITQAGLRSCSAEILPPGSVLFSSRAPIGHVAINTIPMATNQGFKSMVPEPCLDRNFLYWWLRAHRENLESLGNGATFKEVSKAVVERVEIPFPPLEEQKRIAAILDQADSLRRRRQRAIDRLNTLGQAIFYEMFGDPCGMHYRWDTAVLEDIVRSDDGINYGVVQPGPDTEGGVPLIRVADLLSSRIDATSVKKIDPSIERSYRRSRLKGDEILVACVGSIGSVALAQEELRGSNIARAVARVPVDPQKANRMFVAEQIRTNCVQRYFEKETRMVAQPTLNIKQLKATPIILPPMNRQSDFARNLETVESARARNLAGAEHLGRLFFALQSRAFRGDL